MSVSGTLLYEDPPHLVDIYLPSAPTTDSGGGVKLNWSSSPSQVACPCSINTSGARLQLRQDRGGNTTGNRVAFLTTTLIITLVPGTKFITSSNDQDPGRTFIIEGFQSPDRSYGNYSQDIPALTYCNCEELR